MTIPGVARSTAVLLLLVGLAACAEPTGKAVTGPADRTAPSAGSDALLLRVEHVGGLPAPAGQAARLPFLSAYADGRVILQGPVAAIYPGFAWPNIQARGLGRDGVQALVERALAAGVAETGDLGMPSVADLPTTRFTVTTPDGTHVRDVRGLIEAVHMPDAGLTPAQLTARRPLVDLFTELTDLAAGQRPEDVPEPWTPAAVAAVVRPWTAPQDELPPGPDVPWPGPDLPGEPLGRAPGASCVVATGAQATAVIAAAQGANVRTPWSTPDGTRWSVDFRPLLPDESGCDDLLD